MGKKVCGEKEIVYWYNEPETEEENKILCVECSTTVCPETWTLTQTDRRRLEAF